MRKFGLIGYPLSHSFSPKYFNDKFEKEGLTDCNYSAYPISDIILLEGLIATNPALKGLNVTIPYKKQVIPYLDYQSDAVQKISACNCIKIDSGNLYGYNTDVVGFEKSLLPLLTKNHSKALILGTGGAAAAVQYVLEKLEIDFLFVSRSKTSNHSLTYSDVSAEILNEYKLIINTSPVGMYPGVNECPDLPYEHITSEHYLYDLVYNPAQTLFLQKGIERGAVIKNGAEMLVLQAEESWRIWNDENAVVF
jgi:shikimate dehydrogenase